MFVLLEAFESGDSLKPCIKPFLHLAKILMEGYFVSNQKLFVQPKYIYFLLFSGHNTYRLSFSLLFPCSRKVLGNRLDLHVIS